MSNTIKVLKMTQMPYLKYDNLRYQHFLEWCKHASQEHHLPLKLLVSNDYLINWYHDQWSTWVEEDFLTENSAYYNVIDYKSHREVLGIYPREILKVYPSMILNQIRILLSRKLKNEKQI